MCIAQDRTNKAAPKKASSIKLLGVKHELVIATSPVGKAAVHSQPSTSLVHRRSPSNDDTLTTIDSQQSSHHTSTTTTANSPATTAAIASSPSLPASKDTTYKSLASNNDSNNIRQENDGFDFDFSFLQIPTGGIINIPRGQEDEHHALTSSSVKDSLASSEATMPTTHIRMRPQSLDLASLGIILKPRYRGIEKQQQQQQLEKDAKLLSTFVSSTTTTPSPPPRCTTPSTNSNNVSFEEDFVYETPKGQRIVEQLTPPTTPRASGHHHAAFFVDYASIPESVLLPMC
jgi:hypothetical protein